MTCSKRIFFKFGKEQTMPNYRFVTLTFTFELLKYRMSQNYSVITFEWRRMIKLTRRDDIKCNRRTNRINSSKYFKLSVRPLNFLISYSMRLIIHIMFDLI